MKVIDIHQIDTFTNDLFGGNPAGVVTNANELADEEMQKIAREMNLSETAFALAPSSAKADVKLRYFTPTDEIKFCGHATIGALFQLAKLGMFNLGKPGENAVRVETNAGILPMAVTNGTSTRVSFTAPDTIMQAYPLQGAAFAKEFGISVDSIKENGTILKDKNLNYIYIPMASLKILGNQKFNFAHIRKNFGQEGIVVFCLFSNETIEPGSNLHARGLAPNVGVDEDPFTGSMQAGLIKAAKQNGYIDSNKQHIVTEQGHFIGRPGFAEVNDSGNTITVTANAAPVFSTKIELNA